MNSGDKEEKWWNKAIRKENTLTLIALVITIGTIILFTALKLSAKTDYDLVKKLLDTVVAVCILYFLFLVVLSFGFSFRAGDMNKKELIVNADFLEKITNSIFGFYMTCGVVLWGVITFFKDATNKINSENKILNTSVGYFYVLLSSFILVYAFNLFSQYVVSRLRLRAGELEESQNKDLQQRKKQGLV